MRSKSPVRKILAPFVMVAAVLYFLLDAVFIDDEIFLLQVCDGALRVTPKDADVEVNQFRINAYCLYVLLRLLRYGLRRRRRRRRLILRASNGKAGGSKQQAVNSRQQKTRYSFYRKLKTEN